MQNAIDTWYKGLSNKELISEWEKCTLSPPGLPWISMLPHRTLNFFSKVYAAGSDLCGYRYEFSSLKDNIVSLNCPNKVKVTEQPDYISMRTDMFVLTETGFEVYKDTKAMEKTYEVDGQ